MKTQLVGTHQVTYDAVFQHPVSRNLQWRDVRAMLSAIADATEEREESVKFTRNGKTLTIHPPKRKDFSDIHELMKIRLFLEQSGAPELAQAAGGLHLLVVIDHREARIFKVELQGSTPQRITPYDPHESRRHLRYVADDSNGQRLPELKSFYDAVTRALSGAERILVLGTATGSSSAMDHLMTELKEHHPDFARRVVGAIVVNEHHMTEPQLLAQARTFFANNSPSTPPAEVSERMAPQRTHPR